MSQLEESAEEDERWRCGCEVGCVKLRGEERTGLHWPPPSSSTFGTACEELQAFIQTKHTGLQLPEHPRKVIGNRNRHYCRAVFLREDLRNYGNSVVHIRRLDKNPQVSKDMRWKSCVWESWLVTEGEDGGRAGGKQRGGGVLHLHTQVVIGGWRGWREWKGKLEASFHIEGKTAPKIGIFRV